MRLPGWLRRSALALALFAGLLVVVATARERTSDPVQPPPVGLPETPDYHALLVAPDDPDRLWLGTHVGLYESRDAGRSWRVAGLGGEDAMSLAREQDGTLWAAGHEVLARSTDGGGRWTPARPRGLPSFDIHAFAAHRTGALYAAVAGEGLYRSDDGGESFGLVTDEVGADVTSLAVAPDGRLWAADAEQGLLANADGHGEEWRRRLDEAVRGVAASQEEPGRLIVATERGVLLTTDGGRSWSEVEAIEKGAGPVAWAPGDASLAYVVGLDRKLYRTTDAGASWEAVASETETSSAGRFRGSRPPSGIAAPRFALRDQTGKLVRMRELRGRAVAVRFLDSQCTETRPIGAGQIARALDLLPARDRRHVVALAVTTDPKEETPASVRRFLRKHRAEGRVRYLIGSEKEVRPVWNAFDVLPSADTGIDEPHSAPVRVFDANGIWVSTLHTGADLSPHNLAHDLRAALGKDAARG